MLTFHLEWFDYDSNQWYEVTTGGYTNQTMKMADLESALGLMETLSTLREYDCPKYRVTDANGVVYCEQLYPS